jgi:O-antigen ligase
LAGLFALVPAVAVGGGMAMAPLVTLAGLLGVPFRASGRAALGFFLTIAPMIGLLAWAAASLSWTATPSAPLADFPLALRVPLLFAAGLAMAAGAGLLDENGRRIARYMGAGAVVVLCVLLAVEALGDMPLNRMAQPNAVTTDLERNPGKGVSILVVLVWGLIGAFVGGVSHERLIWRIAFVATAALATQFSMLTNIVALGAGLIGWVIAWNAPRIGPVLISAGVAGWMLAAPFVTPLLTAQAQLAERLPLSWQVRLEIWSFAHDRIMEKLPTGWGFDASRTIGDTPRTLGEASFNAIPLHPHSLSLQIWLELGAVGAVLAAAAILALGIAASRTLGRQPAAAAAATAALASAAAIWNVSYGAWQEWWIAAVFAAAAFAILARREETEGDLADFD